jgi:hypothetical protein
MRIVAGSPLLASLALATLLAAPAHAQEAPKLKPSKFSKQPIDITTRAYGAYAGTPKALNVGDVVPDFTLPLSRGGEFKLSEELKKSELMLIFYRGHW